MYVNHTEVFPGQLRYSELNVKDKIENVLRKGHAKLENDVYVGQFENNKSIFSCREALPAIKSPFGYVLIDGHHEVLCSFRMNMQLVPIHIHTDLSHLSEMEFWEAAQKSNLVYLKSIAGNIAHPPRLFTGLEDDPNRYFAALTARKVNTRNQTSHGMEYPLWFKIDKDIPFIEFKIADALYKNGFMYDAATMGNPPFEEVVDRARGILVQANIEGLRVVREKTHYSHCKFQN